MRKKPFFAQRKMRGFRIGGELRELPEAAEQFEGKHGAPRKSSATKKEAQYSQRRIVLPFILIYLILSVAVI